MTVTVSAKEWDGDKPRGRYRVAAKEARTLDGIVFDSAAEMNRYAELRQFERAGRISELKLQPTFPVEINGKPFCVYTADFSYIDPRRAGSTFIVEDVKSAATAKDTASRLRIKAAELAHGITVWRIIR